MLYGWGAGGGGEQRLSKGEVFPAGSGWEYKPLLRLILLLQKDTTQAGHKVSAKRKYQYVWVGQRFAEERAVLSSSTCSLFSEADLGRQHVCPWVKGVTHITLRGANTGQGSLMKVYGKYWKFISFQLQAALMLGFFCFKLWTPFKRFMFGTIYPPCSHHSYGSRTIHRCSDYYTLNLLNAIAKYVFLRISVSFHLWLLCQRQGKNNFIEANWYTDQDQDSQMNRGKLQTALTT